MLKEGRLVFTTSGQRSGAATAKAIGDLNALFGGSTVAEGRGYWRDSSALIHADRIVTVDVAYEPHAENDEKFYDIAMKYLAESGDESVYIRYACGVVQIATLSSCMENEEYDWKDTQDALHLPADDINSVPLVP